LTDNGVHIYVKRNGNSDTEEVKTTLSSYWKIGDHSEGSGNSTAYYCDISPTAEEVKAATRLAAYEEMAKATCGGTSSFKVKLTNSSLSAITNYCGEMYLMSWRAASGYLTISDSYFITADFGDYKAGDSLTYAEAQELIENTDFINEYVWGRIDIRVQITIDILAAGEATVSGEAADDEATADNVTAGEAELESEEVTGDITIYSLNRIAVSIIIDDCRYERMFTIISED
jgi:hypothetical protein